MVKYFCTECEREIESRHVHMDYGFRMIHVYKPTRNLYRKRKCIIWNKHLCMCEKCWNNLADEYLLYSVSAMKKNKNF